MHARILAAALLVAGSAPAWSNCYSVYRGSETIYQSMESPVDLSRPLSEEVPRKFGPGTSMTFTSDNRYCAVIGVAPTLSATSIALVPSASRAKPANTSAPLQLNKFFVGNDNKMASSVGSR